MIVTKAESIATVLLNRPQAFNSFDFEFTESLAAHLTNLAADRDVRGIIITGEGKAFCAGGDLKCALSFPLGPPAGFHILAGHFHQAVLEIRRMPKPVIAAINGVAAGSKTLIEAQMKNGPALGPPRHPDLAFVLFDYLFYDRKPQARTLDLIR